MYRIVQGFISVATFTLISAFVACGTVPNGVDPDSGPGGGDGSVPDVLEVDDPREPGQTEFSNHEPEGTNAFAAPGEQRAMADSTGANFAAQAPEGAAPPSGRTGEVEEADIYRVDQNRLFYLNTYRGFVIYDLNDPKHPKRLSRLPVYGYPVEMFVKDNVVYALLRDALYLTQKEGKLQFERHNVSQLVTIDISNLRQPKVLETIDIVGELREGVSRKIEDTIYVVSTIPQHYYWGWYPRGSGNDDKEQAWVYAFNVADAANPELVDQLKVFEGGGYSNNSGGIASGCTPEECRDIPQVTTNRYFQDVTIAATSNALMVVENWNNHGYVHSTRWDCGRSISYQEAIVSIVDISDPTGKIRLHTKFETRGRLGDQFKQTYFHDDATGKATYIGLFARNEWNNSGCSGSTLIRNTAETWDVTDGANPRRIDALAFGKPNETVRGSAFDPERRVAYAITARRIDPLYAISYEDPANLRVLSEIDGLSGDMNVFRLIEGRRFLIGIGRDNSDTCTGFGDPGTARWRSTNMAVSIIDVRDLSKIRLVQRACVAVDNAEWIGSSLNWNLDQAHKMLGMHSDGKANVISVPVYYYKQSASNHGWWWYEQETAVGLMTWNLAAYDGSKDETEQQVLVNHGTVVHPAGEVRRSVIFTHEGTTDRRMMVNLSDTHISVVDIEQLDRPATQAVVEVAPYLKEMFRFGGYIVEHVGTGSSYGGAGKSEFRIKRAASGLDDAPAVARFAVGQVQRVIKQGNALVLFRYLQEEESGAARYGYGGSATQALIYDLSTPWAPRRRSAITLPANVLPYYSWWCGTPWGSYAFSGQNNWTSVDNGLVFLAYRYDPNERESWQELVHLDLRDLSHPTVDEHALSSDKDTAYLGLVPDSADGRGFFLNLRRNEGSELNGDQRVDISKYYAQRWMTAAGQLSAQYRINLPGQLVRAFDSPWDDGKLYLTHDAKYAYDILPYARDHYGWKTIFRLNLLEHLELDGKPAAALIDRRSFPDTYLRDLVLAGKHLVVNAQPSYAYYGYYGYYWEDAQDAAPSIEDRSDKLMVFELAASGMKELYEGSTGTYGVNLMGIHRERLFLNLPGDGVLAVRLADPTLPVGQHFVRTLGYATHIEFANNLAFIAAGYFGTYELDLAAPVSIGTL